MAPIFSFSVLLKQVAEYYVNRACTLTLDVDSNPPRCLDCFSSICLCSHHILLNFLLPLLHNLRFLQASCQKIANSPKNVVNFDVMGA